MIALLGCVGECAIKFENLAALSYFLLCFLKNISFHIINCKATQYDEHTVTYPNILEHICTVTPSIIQQERASDKESCSSDQAK